MTWKESAEFTMPFGKYKGQALDKIAETDDGLNYLDWLVGEEELYGSTKEAIETYLDDPLIKKEFGE